MAPRARHPPDPRPCLPAMGSGCKKSYLGGTSDSDLRVWRDRRAFLDPWRRATNLEDRFFDPPRHPCQPALPVHLTSPGCIPGGRLLHSAHDLLGSLRAAGILLACLDDWHAGGSVLELTARIPLLPHLQIVRNRIFRVLASLRAWEYGAGSAPIRFTFVPQCPEGRTARSRTSAAHVAGPHCHRQIATFRDFPYVRRRGSRYSQCGFHAVCFLRAVRTPPPNP